MKNQFANAFVAMSEAASIDTRSGTDMIAKPDLRFHVNTVMSRLLSSVAGSVESGQMHTGTATQWLDLAKQAVGTLPVQEAVNAYTGESTDPYRGVRDALGRPQQCSKSLVDIVKNMYDLHEYSEGNLGYGQRQDYANLVELAEMIGLAPKEETVKFAKAIGWVTLEEQEREIDEFMADAEAEQLMGVSEIQQVGSGALVRHVHSQGLFLDGDAPMLKLNGYGGCVCEFPVVNCGGDVLVLQQTSHNGTSITNLSESIHRTCTAAKPGCRVFYAYERDIAEGNDDIGEIVMQGNEVGWLHAKDPRMLESAKARLGMDLPEL